MRISPVGEAALLLSPGADESPGIDIVAGMWASAQAAGIEGLVDLVPAPPFLLARFNPRVATAAAIEKALKRIATSAPAVDLQPQHHVVEVEYGGPGGPDLEAAAGQLGLAPAELARRHREARYVVSSTGFAPGFVYLDGLDATLRLPRRDDPRRRVPAGSVAIAELYSGIYGAGTGGGWWLIGRTEVVTFDPVADPPSPFRLGDTVAFRAKA